MGSVKDSKFGPSELLWETGINKVKQKINQNRAYAAPALLAHLELLRAAVVMEEYADDAAATAAGLGVGDLYATAGTVKVIVACVVAKIFDACPGAGGSQLLVSQATFDAIEIAIGGPASFISILNPDDPEFRINYQISPVPPTGDEVCNFSTADIGILELVPLLGCDG